MCSFGTSNIVINLFDQIDKLHMLNKQKIEIVKKNIKGERIIDILTAIPKKYMEIIYAKTILDIFAFYKKKDVSFLILVYIEKVNVLGKKRMVINCKFGNIRCDLFFFTFIPAIFSMFTENTFVWITGKVEIRESNYIVISHPTFKGKAQENGQVPPYGIKKIYSSNKITHAAMVYVIKTILYGPFHIEWPEDFIENHIQEEYALLSFKNALEVLHFPENHSNLLLERARSRLVVDEILFYHYALKGKNEEVAFKKDFYKAHDFNHYEEIIVDHDQDKNTDNTNLNVKKLVNKCISEINLDFSLSESQLETLEVIFNDVFFKKHLYRIVQGDVGSGKTILAVILAYFISKNGGQVLILVPSKTLANQHYEYFKKYIGENINVEILHNSLTTIEKKRIIQAMSDGTCEVVIGTHSLLSEKVYFNNLELIVLDEQHRFGVTQRHKIISKTQNCHILMTTATPNPRTLMMVQFGLLDLSILTNHKVHNKRKTIAVSIEKVPEVTDHLEKWLNESNKIYWVCGSIHQNVKGEGCLKRFEKIQEKYGNIVGLLHGKMNNEEMSLALENFRHGKTKVLVCTSVVEVGIDIHDATIMIIENGEMFGLAQLHQLRGRVGRGKELGKCMILYDKSNEESVKRVENFIDLNSGFSVSNLDYNIRGPGDLIGTAQSGRKNFFFIGKNVDQYLIMMAKSIFSKIKNFEVLEKIYGMENYEEYLY